MSLCAVDKIIRLLGQGTFGKVVEAWDRDARCTVAVKVIRAIQKYRYAAPFMVCSYRNAILTLRRVLSDASKVEIKVLNLLRDRDPSNIKSELHILLKENIVS